MTIVNNIVRVLVAQSSQPLFIPMDCSLPGSSVRGILQATILEWIAIPLTRGSSQPRDQTWVSCIADRFFTIWATRETVADEPLNHGGLTRQTSVLIPVSPTLWRRQQGRRSVPFQLDGEGDAEGDSSVFTSWLSGLNIDTQPSDIGRESWSFIRRFLGAESKVACISSAYWEIWAATSPSNKSAWGKGTQIFGGQPPACTTWTIFSVFRLLVISVCLIFWISQPSADTGIYRHPLPGARTVCLLNLWKLQAVALEITYSSPPSLTVPPCPLSWTPGLTPEMFEITDLLCAAL